MKALLVFGILLGLYILFGGTFEFLTPADIKTRAAFSATTGYTDSGYTTGTWICLQNGVVISTVDPVHDVNTMKAFEAKAQELRAKGLNWSGEQTWHQQGDCDVSPPPVRAASTTQQSGNSCLNEYYWDSEAGSCKPVIIPWQSLCVLVPLTLIITFVVLRKLGWI